MPVAVKLRDDYSAAELRALARRSKDVNQSRRLLSLAALRDGMDRGEAAKIGGMDRQTLRDWVRRFNVKGPDGLIDDWTSGPTPRLSAEQLDELAKIVERGPDRKVDGVVRWRRIDLKRVIAERFGVDYHARYVGKLLKKLGFPILFARPLGARFARPVDGGIVLRDGHPLLGRSKTWRGLAAAVVLAACAAAAPVEIARRPTSVRSVSARR